MTAASNARRALEALQSVGLTRAALDGAVASMAEELPDGAVDPEAVTKFSRLQAAAEQAGDPALQAALAETKVLLQDKDVQDWMKQVDEGDNEADQKIVEALRAQQENATRSYEAWLAQLQKQQEELERACQEALRRQADLVARAEQDTAALNKGEDADYVEEAKETAAYAAASAEVDRTGAALDAVTAELAAFDEANKGVVDAFEADRCAIDDATSTAVAAGSGATAERQQVLALMSGSLRPEIPAVSEARAAVAGRFKTDAEQTAFIEAVRGVAPVAADPAISSLLEQYDAPEASPEQRAQLCAEMAIHLRQDPRLAAAWALPESAVAAAAESPGNAALRAQMERIGDIKNVGSLRLRNPQAISALATVAGVDDAVRGRYDSAAAALPKYSQRLALTAQRDGLQFQHDGARRAREHVVAGYVAEKSLHGALVKGRQAVETAGPELERVFAPQLATIRAFEAKLEDAKDKDPDKYRELVESPEALKVKALADKIGTAADQFAANKAQHDFSGFLRQNATRTMQTGHVTNIVTRDPAGRKIVYGRLSAAETNSQQTVYGGSGSFLWQHLGSTARQTGLALGLINSPLQQYRVEMANAAAAKGFHIEFMRDDAGNKTGLFVFRRNDGSGQAATPREHSAILQDASARTARMGGRYHMRIQEHSINADTAAAERAGDVGFAPTGAAAAAGPGAPEPSAPVRLTPTERNTLVHKIVDDSDTAIKEYGGAVTEAKATLAEGNRAMVFEGTGELW